MWAHITSSPICQFLLPVVFGSATQMHSDASIPNSIGTASRAVGENECDFSWRMHLKRIIAEGVETFTIRSKNLKDASLRLKRATKIVNGLFFIWCESEKNQIMVCDILSHSEIYNYSQA